MDVHKIEYEPNKTHRYIKKHGAGPQNILHDVILAAFLTRKNYKCGSVDIYIYIFKLYGIVGHILANVTKNRSFPNAVVVAVTDFRSPSSRLFC